jgi:hypothetical protein
MRYTPCDIQKNIASFIDHICINQLNLDEKSRQAQLMGQIYSKAECVRVWLGRPNADIDEAFKTVIKSPTYAKESTSS